MPDFSKLNVLDRAETFRIDATGELINVADYEHDPSTLSDFFATKTSILNGFSLISTMYYQCCPGIWSIKYFPNLANISVPKKYFWTKVGIRYFRIDFPSSSPRGS